MTANGGRQWDRVLSLIFNGLTRATAEKHWMLLSERQRVAEAIYDELVAGGVEVRTGTAPAGAETVKLAGVKQITPKSGDVIAVEVDQYLTDDEALTLAEQVRAAFPGYPILIVEQGRLAVLTREMAEAVNAASTAQNASAALARYAASRKTAEDMREARKSLGYTVEEIERMEGA